MVEFSLVKLKRVAIGLLLVAVASVVNSEESNPRQRIDEIIRSEYLIHDSNPIHAAENSIVTHQFLSTYQNWRDMSQSEKDAQASIH